jgi:hypothetical protein
MILTTLDVSRAQAPAQAQAPPAVVAVKAPIDLTGSWSGHWEDCQSGHSGKLWAEFCKCDDTHYKVTFTGRFFKVFPFRYSVVLNVVGSDPSFFLQKGEQPDSAWLKHLLPYIEQELRPAGTDKIALSGQSDLGRLFGTFTYQAAASATCFVAHYSSCRYQGKFVLSRCCGQ